MSIKDIALKIGCSKKIVDDIFHRRTWNHISCDFDFSHRKLYNSITKEEAKEIRKLLDEGALSSKEIASIIGCKVHHVKDIKRGKTWKSL